MISFHIESDMSVVDSGRNRAESYTCTNAALVITTNIGEIHNAALNF